MVPGGLKEQVPCNHQTWHETSCVAQTGVQEPQPLCGDSEELPRAHAQTGYNWWARPQQAPRAPLQPLCPVSAWS